MNGEELKSSLKSKGHVKYSGIEYELSAIIYRIKDGKIAVSVELLDKNKRCVVIAPAEKVDQT
jgi:hypothetical protein